MIRYGYILIENSRFDLRLLSILTFRAENLTTLTLSCSQEISIPSRFFQSFEPFNKVKNLLFNNFIFPENFLETLKKLFPNLEKLEIKNCKGLNTLDKSKSFGLKFLKEIVIVNADINEMGVKGIILGAEKLEKIWLEDCENITNLDINSIEISYLSQNIRSVKISNLLLKNDYRVPYINISASTIKWLLEQKSLEHLTLAYCNISQPTEFIGNGIFSNEGLIEVDLENSVIAHAFLIWLLSPNASQRDDKISIRAKFLSVTGIPDSFDYLQLTDAPVKMGISSGSNIPLVLQLITEDITANFIGVTNHISININEKKVPHLKVFLHVEDIILTDSVISIADFLMLLRMFPNVKKIEGKNTKILYDASQEVKISDFGDMPFLNKLKEFIFKYPSSSQESRSNFPGELLILILKISPCLEKIIFQDVTFTNLNPSLMPGNLELKYLSQIHIFNSDLSQEVLDKLDSYAPIIQANKAFFDRIAREKSNIPKIRNDNNKPISKVSANDQPHFSFLENLTDMISFSSGRKKENQAPNNQPIEKQAKEKLQTEVKSQTEEKLQTKGKSQNVEKARSNNNTNSDYLKVPPEDKSKENSEKPKVNASRLFISDPIVDPGRYRLQVFHRVERNSGSTFLKAASEFDKCLIEVKKEEILKSDIPLSQEFNKKYWSKEISKELEEEAIIYPKYALYVGDDDKPFYITNEWQALPSLFPGETIKSFYTDYKGEYEIKYSEVDHLYYIKAENGSKSVKTNACKINYILELPDHLDLKKSFTPEINEIIGEFSDDDPSLGTCLQRATKCQEKLQKADFSRDGYSFKIIINEIHAFIEITKDRKCYVVDLGGVEVDLKIKEIDTSEFKRNENKGNKDSSDKLKLENQSNTSAPKNQGGDLTNKLSESQKKYQITENDLCPELITWPTNQQSEDDKITVEEVFKKMSARGKNTLIKLEDPNDCLKVLADFSKFTEIQSKDKKPTPYLLIDLADDFQWVAPGLKLTSSKSAQPSETPITRALKVKKAFSKITHFTKKYPKGIVFINWSNFSNTDLTAFHAILDENRKLEGKDFPLDLPIVGFYSNKIANPYNGSDFTSRHDYKKDWDYEFTEDVYHKRIKKLDIPPDNVLVVDLFESEDWESLLFGPLFIEKKQFSLALSDFLKGIEDAKNPLKKLHIKNPPLHLRSFQLFWQHALQQNWFELYGRTFNLDAKCALTYSSSYQIEIESIKKLSDDKIDFTYPLGKANFHEFFPHYVYQENSFERKTGLLELYKNKAIRLVVTESLPENDWARLLAEAKRCQTSLVIERLKDVTIKLPSCFPEELIGKFEINIFPLQTQTPESLEKFKAKQFAIIQATENNIDTVTTELLKQYPGAKYIDLDETHDFGDLFYQIRPTLSDTEGVLADFIESDIWKALKKGETVIIEGILPKLLIDALLPTLISEKSEIIINEKPESFSGKLIMVTTQSIPMLKDQFPCLAKPEEIAEVFNPVLNAKEEFVDGQSEENKAKAEIEEINNATASKIIYSHDDLSEEACEHYKYERFNKIMAGFKNEKGTPIVSYMGSTGIGKSSYFLNKKAKDNFVKDYFKRNKREAKLYIGMEELENFAKHDDPNVDPFCFVDEANLSAEKLSLLKGVTSKKKHLLKNGHYYPLKNNHRIILVSNPKSYGGVRQQQEFFDQYTQEVLANSPHPAFLYHEVMKPHLEKNVLIASEIDKNPEDFLNNSAKTILSIYNKVNEIVGTPDPLLTPRHLEMITLLFNHYCEKFKDKDIAKNNKYSLAAAACLSILGDSLSSAQKESLLKFLTTTCNYDHQKFMSLQCDHIKNKIGELSKKRKVKFVFTESRYPVLSLLDDFISLNKAKSFHFGLLLEGDSASGKSSLVKAYFELLGTPIDAFSFGRNYESDCQTLLNAKKKGKPILIDEINAGGPRYERLLNGLVMDQIEQEDTEGEENKCMPIGTENDLTHSGRDPLSPALKARFTKLIVPEYPEEELIQILVDEGLARNQAEEWIKKLNINREYAISNGLEPVPNLRDVLKKVRKENGKAEDLDLNKDSEEENLNRSTKSNSLDLKSNSNELGEIKKKLSEFSKQFSKSNEGFIAEIGLHIEYVNKSVYGEQSLKEKIGNLGDVAFSINHIQ